MDAELAQENVAPPFVYLPSDTLVCAGTVYDASFNGPQFDYNWQPGPDSASITLNTSGIYTLQVTDQYGCYTRPQMDVTISVPDASFTGQQSGTSLNWTFTPNDPNGTSYAWNFGDGGTSAQMIPLYTYATDGSYLVTLTMADSIGCSDTDSSTIQFVFVGTEEFAIGLEGRIFPNPFTDRLEVALNHPAKGSGELTLSNELGQVLLQQEFRAGAQRLVLGTGSLPAGVYLLSVRMADQHVVHKVVKVTE